MDPFGAAVLRETHVAVVVLLGDRAYKLKKPVDAGFLDFRTRESRLRACRREVVLNRRLAPDVYLGVSDVSDVDGAVCDHLVVMRRMPDSRRLSTLVGQGVPLRDTVVRLARMVAAFHAGARRGPLIDAQGSRDAISGRWEDSFAQVDALPRPVIDEPTRAAIRELTRAFLAGRDPLFADRLAHGRIVDGHGDLLADDIFCLDDGPRILDCLEFDDRLRYLDGLDDIAFLAMDLERLGAPDLGRLLLDRYAEFAGDPAPASLREHYLAYRAFVRAKVACLRERQGAAEAGEQARRFAELTLRHLTAGRVRLVCVGGLPGTGKTTVAGLLADRLGAVLLSNDRLRKELAGLAAGQHAPAAYRDGIYASGHTAHTYRELFDRAEKLLARGESVVLDASFTDSARQAAAAELAGRTHSAFTALRTTVPAHLAAARLRERTGSISDADERVAAAMAADADPWPEAGVVSTAGTPEEALATALSLLPTR